MTKFIIFDNEIVELVGARFSAKENNRIYLAMPSCELTFENFNSNEERDARFEELKRMLCGEDGK